MTPLQEARERLEAASDDSAWTYLALVAKANLRALLDATKPAPPYADLEELREEWDRAYTAGAYTAADWATEQIPSLLDELSHLRGEVERLTGISDEQRARQALSTPEAARPDNGLRKCKGCGDTYHEFWGCLRSNCTGAD